MPVPFLNSLQKTKDILDLLPDGLLIVDKQRRILFANQQLENIFGYDRNELTGEPVETLIPDRFADKHSGEADAYIRKPPPRPMSYGSRLKGKRKDDSEVLVSVSLTPARLGNDSAILCAVRDVSTLNDLEDQVREQQIMLKESQRISAMGHWSLDLIHDHLYWSDEVFTIFEIDASQFAPSYSAFLAAIHPDDRELVNQAYTNSLATRKPYEIEHRLLMKDGRIKYVIERCETEFDMEGNAMKSIGTIQDITDRYILEKKLQQSQKMDAMGTLLGGVSHEFGNLLAGIRGQLYLTRKLLADHPQALEKVIKTEQLVVSSSDLILRLLSFSRKSPASMDEVDFSALIEEAVFLCRFGIQKDIQIEVDIRDHAISHGDQPQLLHAVVNLINNAGDALKKSENKRIRILLECCSEEAIPGTVYDSNSLQGDRYIHLCVEDNGCGISRSDLPRVTEPFFSSKGKHGTGLGLSMVHGAAHTHKGILHLESTEGEGTSVHMYLPVINSDDFVENEEQPATQQPSTLHDGLGI